MGQLLAVSTLLFVGSCDRTVPHTNGLFSSEPYSHGYLRSVHIGYHSRLTCLALPLLQCHMLSTANELLQPYHVKGWLWRGISRRLLKVSMNSSLDISVPFWELGRAVIHPPPSQDHYSFRLAFLPKVSFRASISHSYLSTLIYHPTSLHSLNWFACDLISSSSPFSKYLVRNSHNCSDISKLAGAVWAGSGIPMPSRFTPQVIRLWR